MSIERINNDESNQALIEKLRAIIEIESSKPIPEQDVDLIDECVDYLMELENGIELTDEELKKGKKQIYMLLDKNKKPQKNIRFKGLLIAACLAILILLANLVALACGFDTISLLKEWGNRIVSMVQGEQIEYKGITILKDEKIIFSSIEEFNNETQLKILYPTKLPENINLSIVTLGGSYDKNNNFSTEYYDVVFATNDPQTSITIHTYPEFSNYFISNSNLSKENINGYECYLDFMDTEVQCSFAFDENSYVIRAKNYEDIKTIVLNLKENTL